MCQRVDNYNNNYNHNNYYNNNYHNDHYNNDHYNHNPSSPLALQTVQM